MATAKAKTVKKSAVKKSAKAPAKKAAPKAKAKVVAKPKLVAKTKVSHAPPPKAAKPAPQKSAPHKTVPPKNESVFARLLREKNERHQQFLKQNEGQHHSHDQRMPQNHASYSKFAGPRRRAS